MIVQPDHRTAPPASSRATGPPRSGIARVAAVAALAAGYFLAGKFGLTLAFLNSSASAVWPPTGIALWALIVFGPWLWPGILLGAFLVNLTTAGGVATSVAIAAGNTLEGLLGAHLVQRFARGRRVFDRPRTIFQFTLLAGVLSTMVSATVGVTTLAVAGLAPWHQYGPVWLTWWLGDATGALVLAPLLVLWSVTPPIEWNLRRSLEGIALVLSLVLVAGVVFAGVFEPTDRDPLGFLCIPLLVWAGFRFGMLEAATATVLIETIAVYGTLRGHGPFARPSPNESLVLLQAFIGVVSVTVLAMAASVTERRRAERRIGRLNLDLERRVRERTLELHGKNEELRAEVASHAAAEERLLASEGRLREAQGMAHIGSWEWDIEANVVWWSEELHRIYGVAPDSFVASYEGFLERVHPDDRERVDGVVRAAFQDGRPFEFDHRIVRPDGAVRTLHASGQVLVGEQGRPIRMAGTGQDITERKQAEEERERLAAERAARREAEEANRLKDEFLATLSHELRTPLNAIIGWAHLLREGRLDEDATARAIETIRRNADAQNHLISELLDLSSIESGKLRLTLQPVNLAAVLESAADAARPAALAKRIALEVVAPRDVPEVLADPDRLQQVVGNLLANAVKFSHEDGRIELRLAARDGFAEILVADEGPGIPAEILPHVFDRFRQADSSSTRRHRGLGLGLAIVHRLVQLHGGAVRAQNRETGGAVLTVHLPLPPPEALAAERGARSSGLDGRPDPSNGAILRGIRILVVDDEQDSREMLAAILTRRGAEVTTRGSSAEALRVLSESVPDLLLTDIEMPGEDGYELLAKARRLLGARDSSLPAVAVTAYARPEDVTRALRAGFQAHIAKPLSPDEVTRIAADLVRGHSTAAGGADGPDAPRPARREPA